MNNPIDDQRLTVRLMADWGMGPFWVKAGNSVADPYDTEEIAEVVSLSPDLLRDVAAWDSRLQAVFDDADPGASAFPTRADETRFVQDGRLLAHRLRQEVPADTAVEYVPWSGAEPEMIDRPARPSS
jgi:hypothetical protein